MSTPVEQPEEAAIKKKLVFKVFGLGGAGCNAAGFACQAGFAGVEFQAVNTDSQSLEACAVPAKFVLGATRTRGLGAGGDPELGRAAAEEDLEKIRAFCDGADVIFLLAGLGGGTGTGAAPVFARVAREKGALVLALVTLPFDFEGDRRQFQAQTGLQQLKANADAVICLPNRKLFKLLDENTSVLEGFKISNGLLAEGLRGIWRMLTQTGLINVDFADLCSVTRGRHAASFFATAEASGEKRVEQVIEKLLAHPLLDGGQVLNESDALLVSIVGGLDVMMSEIHKLMEPLHRHCENAHIIFGAAIDEAFAGRLSVTLIASCRRPEEVPPPLTTAPPEPVESAQFLDTADKERPASRFIVPPPALSEERRAHIMRVQGGRSRKKLSRLQKELPLEIVFRGRFEKSEPTIRHGEDLDVPTYIRRGVPLN
ncbi:MAG TPA: cell division protein FtsZ [Verrucomicrobiae bacterium]|jgi:cell division protein FtsZ|nr:cell division protein FtsZ [Verrucomicrobiae bacterium]